MDIARMETGIHPMKKMNTVTMDINAVNIKAVQVNIKAVPVNSEEVQVNNEGVLINSEGAEKMANMPCIAFSTCPLMSCKNFKT